MRMLLRKSFNPILSSFGSFASGYSGNFGWLDNFRLGSNKKSKSSRPRPNNRMLRLQSFKQYKNQYALFVCMLVSLIIPCVKLVQT